MFLRGVANTFDNVTRVRPVPSVGQVDYKTSGCLDGLVINGNAITGCGEASYDALQIGLSRRFRSGLTGGLQYQYSRNEGTTQGSNEAATAGNTFDYNTEFGPNLERHPAHLQRLARSTCCPARVSGRAAGASAASSTRAAACRSTSPSTAPIRSRVGGVTVTNIPGGNTRGTLRPDLVPGVDPYLKDGVRWLNPAAFAAPLPGTFGNLPRNFLRGPEFWQVDLMTSKDFRFAQDSGHSDPVRDLQHHQPAELREPGGGAARRAPSGSRSPTPSPARSATCWARSTARSGSAPRARRRSRFGICSRAGGRTRRQCPACLRLPSQAGPGRARDFTSL